MKVAFGGSFNPPTIAHKRIIEYLSNNFEEVIVIPNASNYQKNDLISFKHRLEMLKIMTNKYKNVTISDLENRRGFVGTFQTLRDLGHPYFACGEDCVDQFINWINPNCLLSENKFLIFTRTSSEIKIMDKINKNDFLKKYKKNFKIVKIDFPNISSSLFRESHNKDIVDDEIYLYIEKHKLYK